MSTPTPTIRSGVLGSVSVGMTAPTDIGGDIVSPISEFEELSSSIASLRSYVHVNGKNDIVSPHAVSDYEDDEDEIVWPLSPDTSLSSPVSAGTDQGQDVISLASSLDMSLSMMSLSSDSVSAHSRTQSGVTPSVVNSEKIREHARSRSVPILGEDVVLVGTRTSSVAPLVPTDRNSAALPLENERSRLRDTLWSEEVECASDGCDSVTRTPTMGAFVEMTNISTAMLSTTTNTDVDVDGKPRKVVSAAWRRRNRRKKAAAAAAAVASRDGVVTPPSSQTGEFSTPPTTPSKQRTTRRDNKEGRIKSGVVRKEESVIDGSAVTIRSHPLAAPNTKASTQTEFGRPVTPPIRPRAPEPVQSTKSTPTRRKGKKKNGVMEKDEKRKTVEAVGRTGRGKGDKGGETEMVDAAHAGLGLRPVVDDVSENGDDRESLLSTAYEEAVNFMDQ